MSQISRRCHGRTAHPALIGLVVGFVIWLILALAGNDLVRSPQHISGKTSVAVLAVLKDFQMWVALGIGSLVAFWASQMRQSESIEDRRLKFVEWSTDLPQWRPMPEGEETAAFVVPLARVECGEFKSQEPAPATAPQAVAGTTSVAIMRLAPLQDMAQRFAAAHFPGVHVHNPGMALAAPVRSGGLVRAARVEIPARLLLAALQNMGRIDIERLAGECFRRQGYDVAAIGQGRSDSGVDLLLQRKAEVIVVKCFTGEDGEVPLEAAREMLNLVLREGATRGVLLTTGTISRKVRKFARRKGRGRLEIIDGWRFESLLHATASGAGASPACPCCRGPMSLTLERRLFRKSIPAWVCQSVNCDGMIRQGDVLPEPKPLAA